MVNSSLSAEELQLVIEEQEDENPCFISSARR